MLWAPSPGVRSRLPWKETIPTSISEARLFESGYIAFSPLKSSWMQFFLSFQDRRWRDLSSPSAAYASGCEALLVFAGAEPGVFGKAGRMFFGEKDISVSNSDPFPNCCSEKSFIRRHPLILLPISGGRASVWRGWWYLVEWHLYLISLDYFGYNCRQGSQPAHRNEVARPVLEAWELWKLWNVGMWQGNRTDKKHQPCLFAQRFGWWRQTICTAQSPEAVCFSRGVGLLLKSGVLFALALQMLSSFLSFELCFVSSKRNSPQDEGRRSISLPGRDVQCSVLVVKSLCCSSISCGWICS